MYPRCADRVRVRDPVRLTALLVEDRDWACPDCVSGKMLVGTAAAVSMAVLSLLCVCIIQGTVKGADATVVYANDKVFADLLSGALSVNKAILTGKLKVREAPSRAQAWPPNGEGAL